MARLKLIIEPSESIMADTTALVYNVVQVEKDQNSIVVNGPLTEAVHKSGSQK